jgi:LuxR family maltose regulon positive regulatory protein
MQCEAGLSVNQRSVPGDFAFALLPRPEQIARLDAAARGSLTVVVSPAGWGKTVLCSQWATSTGKNVSWLDCRTTQPLATLASFCEAAFVDGSLADLSEAALLAQVAGEFRSLSDWYFVLDELDRIPTNVRAQIGELVEMAPAHIHFIATTRADVLFPASTARLAVRDDVAYLRPSDLAFDRDTTDALISGEINRRLAPDEIEMLLIRTGGWPAALRLAAQAARDSTDAHAALLRFDGTDERLRAYCRAEILAAYPEPIGEFFLTTCVPERFTSGLAGVLSGRDDVAALIELIDSAELTQRDERRPGEHRYRPGLHQALRAELATRPRTEERDLLRQAAGWHIEQGTLDDFEIAAEYLVRAEDWPAVLAHVEQYTRRMHEQARTRVALGWLLAVPESVRRADTRVTLAEAALRTLVGETLRAESTLRALGDRSQMPTDERLAVETIRAVWVLGHLPIVQAQEAANEITRILETEPNALSFTMAGIVTTEQTLAVASCAHAWGSWMLGNFDEARELLRVESQTGDYLPMPRLHRLGALALVEAWAGSLNRAVEYVDEARAIARRVLAEDHPYLSMAELANVHVLIERGERKLAATMLERVRRLSATVRFDVYQQLITLESAWLAFAEGDLDDALAFLDGNTFEFERAPLFAARHRALAARILLARDERSEARHRLDPAANQSDTALTGARVQFALAHEQPGVARAIVDAWPAGGEVQSELARDLWSATITFTEGQTQAGLEAANAVFRRAEREGHVRLFLDAGPEVRQLLATAAQQSPSPYVLSLSRWSVEAALASDEERALLSAREREVLVYLADRMTYAEIAEQLFISQNTVKSHAKSVYTKLGVRGRREASVRAQELGLL